MIQSPCRGCTERKLSCHVRCSRYAEYKERQRRAAEAERTYKRLDTGSYSKLKAYDACMADRQKGIRH